MSPRIALVIGTRPELIKLAPLATALADGGARVTLLLTGQHPGLDLAGAGLEMSTLRLSHPQGLEPLEAADTISTAAQAVLQHLRPDWVVVQGDTSSALGGARAAVALGLPLAHVEAGLRSGDPAMPWPEEPFRIEIDAASDLLFAPTAGARVNLIRERVRGEVVVTGNTGIDALRLALLRTPVRAPRDGPPLILLTAHRRENVGPAMAGIAEGVRRAADGAAFRLVILTHPRPDTAALTRQAFAGLPRTRFLPPQSPAQTLRWMLRSTAILSDSGGISEEAPTLGRPLLILRDRTERPEAVEAGSAVLVGSDPVRIRDGLLDLLEDPVLHASRALPRPVFGDGHAAGRIASALLNRARHS